MKLKKRDPLRTEAAIKKAVKLWAYGDLAIKDYGLKSRWEIGFYQYGDLIAVADLRDLYRKRQPLRGITKAVRRAVHPRSRR